MPAISGSINWGHHCQTSARTDSDSHSSTSPPISIPRCCCTCEPPLIGKYECSNLSVGTRMFTRRGDWFCDFGDRREDNLQSSVQSFSGLCIFRRHQGKHSQTHKPEVQRHNIDTVAATYYASSVFPNHHAVCVRCPSRWQFACIYVTPRLGSSD